MTPNWLLHHSLVTKLSTATDTLLTFDPDLNYERLIRVPICLDECADKEEIVVEATLSLVAPVPPTTDSDFWFGICDESGRCNGVYLHDLSNNAPCNFGTATSGKLTAAIVNQGNCGGRVRTETHFSEEVTLTFYPKDMWGSYHIPTNGGFSASTTFNVKVDTTGKCFFLEMFSNEANEIYKLQYIKVEVHQN